MKVLPYESFIVSTRKEIDVGSNGLKGNLNVIEDICRAYSRILGRRNDIYGVKLEDIGVEDSPYL